MALLAYNRKKQFLAPDVEGLIKHLTGFEEDSRNYQEVAKFAYSNIIYHNFATVDITAVKRSIEGIVEKFKIHGLNSRGKRLQELVDKYVASDSSQHSQLNVQWHVLLLLLKLSYNPTSVPEHALKVDRVISKPSVQEEEIDWPLYLSEGYERFQCPNDLSEDEELWQSSSEEDVEESRHEPGRCSSVPLPPVSRSEALRSLLQEAAQSEEWLRHHIQHSWWCDLSCQNMSDCRDSLPNPYNMWENCMSARYKRDSLPLLQTQVVSEYNVLQEVLWMLQVSTDSGLFCLNNEGLFRVNPYLTLSSTTPDSLRLFLEDICPYFDMISNLRKFEKELSNQEMSEEPPSVTYKAYSAALSHQLNNLNQMVIKIQTKLNKQEETMTLISVLEELTPGLHMLHYLYDVHSRAVADWYSHPAWLCATRLLSVLYEAMLEASNHIYLAATLDIFMHSFHVYLDIIDVWLSEGRLDDWRKEFLVIRKEGVLEVMPYEQEMRKCGVSPVPLLSKLVILVRDAGNTMEVVSQLNKLSELRDIVHNKGCLFKEFTKNVYDEIKRLSENIEVELSVKSLDVVVETSCSHEDSSSGEETSEDSAKTTDVDLDTQTGDLLFGTDSNETLVSEKQEEKTTKSDKEIPNYLGQLSEQAMYDQTMRALTDTNPLLTKALYTQHAPDHDTTPTAEPVFGTSLAGLMSVHSVLETQMELVSSRHKIASRLVTETLRQQYSLQEHFTVLRSVFFMESGNLAQRFYTYLFKEIEAGTWKNSLSLSAQLQVCVEEFYPGFGNHFLVLIQKGAERTDDVHRAIPAISLAYRVDWPVSTIISQDTIDCYNKVFRFLLYLKYASSTLASLHFSDLSTSSNVLRTRRLQVLKLWMYHSTNTLHSYFMSQVLHSFSAHLEQSILLADSTDNIIQAHVKFLGEVKIHCLQDKKTHVETYIMKLLRLCSSLSVHWRKEADNSLSDSDIQTLEEHYLSSYRGLVHCLDVITAEGEKDSFLCELWSEISHSVPDPYYAENI
ncbi:gamma-tubulin complex component 5 [Homalodisca vitripennis]|uniref:gamma-tubulin complex component 5 n=1 Tax=Homalodisca vitripennis TaxID=197043 RepID=UPI001EEA5C51|nr:gamma-tubulin complex component 5 [Homalodisca vitripennis]XP_046671950.1 gamma-tubulin complex component 5 [Homalodisca vitripennis]